MTLDDLVVVPADVPDLPGLVAGQGLRVLPRVDLAIAPERDGVGCVALGMSLPLADWLAPDLLDLDRSPLDRLRSRSGAAVPLDAGAGLAPAAHSRRPPIGSTRAWRAGRRLARCWPARRLP